MTKDKKIKLAFGILLGLTIVFMGLNGGFQSNFGSIDVRTVEIRSVDGKMVVGKLYRPIEADSSNPLPGVLAIHGYNNDKDVQRPNAIELAKRGVVVLAIDALHQGDSDKGDAVFASVPFEAYEWLESQPFVDSDKTGVVGHSMGAFFAAAVAAAYPQIDVLGYQAFRPIYLTANIPQFVNNQTNVIQITSAYEEFGGRQWNQTAEMWKETVMADIGINTAIAGIADGTTEFSKTYGDISAGTGQRYVWRPKTHPAQTHDIAATKEIVSFFLQALTGVSETEGDAAAEGTTYWIAETFGALSALTLMLTIIPLASLLLGTKMFAAVKQPMPEMKEKLKTKPYLWWVFAVINFIIGGAVYLFATNAPPAAGEGMQTWMLDANNIAEWTPLYDMGVANGFLAFYVVNAIINVILLVAWYFGFMRSREGNLEDFAAYTHEKGLKENLVFLGKTVLLAITIFLFMYTLVYFASWLWVVEIRGPWSMFKLFTQERAWRFWIYFPGVLFFWIFNGGMWLFGLMRQKEYGSEGKTVFIWWLKACFAVVTGLILLNLINYAPMWFGWTGPLFQKFDAGFAPMYLLQTWLSIPLVMVSLLIGIYYFRKTGRIWLGSIILAVVATWLMVTGTVIDPTVL